MKRINKNHPCYMGDRNRDIMFRQSHYYYNEGYTVDTFCNHYLKQFTNPYSFERKLMIKFHAHAIEFIDKDRL